MESLKNGLKEAVKKVEEELEKRESGIKYNLCNVFKKLLWTVVMENDRMKTGESFAIELSNMIDEIFKTTYEKNPDYDSYPSFEATERFEKAYEVCRVALEKYGIKEHK
jgi:hypothetical protein